MSGRCTTKVAAGKFTDIQFDDDSKRIEGTAKAVDDDEWEKVVEGDRCDQCRVLYAAR